MPLFEVKRNIGKSLDKTIANKAKNNIKITSTVKGGNDLISRINQIKATVETNLGQYKNEYQVITDKEILHDFITECIGNSYISIDTETSGLDPLQNTLAGICPYTFGQKGSYIPLNHISYITKIKSSGQLDMDFVISEFKRLLAKKPEIDMFNANFDIRFLRANGLSDIYCTWDGYLASRVLNENEEHKNLKQLHNKYCLDGKGDAFRFDDLFKGIPFTLIPYNVGYLYAAHDPVITTELCEYQRKYLYPGNPREDMQDLYRVFKDIEMPCIDVVTDMEDNGILFDNNYAQELSVEYHKKLSNSIDNFHNLLDTLIIQPISHHYIDDRGRPYSITYPEQATPLIDMIKHYKLTKPDNKLDNPINIGSPTQIAILLYDILKLESPDKKSPRGTGVEILSKIDNPITKAILEYREVQKLLSTYIDKLPECVNPKDGRIHCHFNQYGADTGRMSSSDPNLQNIPSKNHDIRKMFIATNETLEVPETNNSFIVDKWLEVNTVNGWKYADAIVVGDKLSVIDNNTAVEIIVKRIETLVYKNQIVYYY